MSLRILSNAERLVMEYLRTVDEVTDVVGERIFTTYDAARGLPQVVVVRIGGFADTNEHLDHPLLQIEVWGEKGTRPLTHQVMQLVRAAMGNDNIAGVHEQGVVTGSTELNMLYLPDPDSSGGPARPRYVFDIRLHVHPKTAPAFSAT